MKKFISLILILTLFMTVTITPVSAAPKLDINKLQQNLETIIMNKAEDAKAFLSIAVELIEYAVAKFSDVKETDWFAEAVGKLNILKIIDGLPDGSFNPQGEVTRAQFVKMLVQAMEYKKVDSVSFKDLKPFPSSKAHWASVYIETALRNGVIVKEEIGENFFPDVPLTREDMGMMMFRALKLEPSEGENPFADMTEANNCLTRLYEEYLIRGIIEGGKRLYNPQGISTRAEAAAIISRMVEYKADPEGYKTKMAAEENYNSLVARIKAGNYTEEDLIAKAEIEKEKQKLDTEYIPEPILKVEHTNSKTIHARVSLLNYRDYNNDFKIKMNCTNYTDINSIRTNSLIGLQIIKLNDWKESALAGGSIFDIRERNGKFVGNTCEYFNYNFKPGTLFIFKITYKRSNMEKAFDYTVTIQ